MLNFLARIINFAKNSNKSMCYTSRVSSYEVYDKQFLPAHISVPTINQAAIQSIVLKLPNGISLQVASNTDKAFLKAVFELLGVTSC